MTTHYWHPHTGGIETVAKAHATELARRGWSVTAHSSRVDASTPKVVEADGVRLVRHRMLNPLERRFSVPVPIPVSRIAPLLESDAQDANVIVAHGHVYPITSAAARAARRIDCPFVIVQHSPWVDYSKGLELIESAADRIVGRRVLEQADLVLCVSRFTQDYVRRIAPRSRTQILTNGVDTDRFVPDTGDEIRPVRTSFVCVRRLVPRTGVDLLLDAWRIADLGPNASLVIAGDGPMRAHLERDAETLENVSFAGRVSDAQLVELMQRADATVVPTRSGEGFGLVAAESHACGTPVIATDQGALGEVVHHNVDGLLVARDDPGALAVALARFTNEPALRTTLRMGARSTDWSWHRVGDALDGLLRSIAR